MATDEDERVVSPPRVAFLGAMLLAMGASGFYHLPGMIKDDAEGSRIVNSIYCSVITLTTYVAGCYLLPRARRSPYSCYSTSGPHHHTKPTV